MFQHMVAETSCMLTDTSVHDVRYLTQYVVTNTLCCSDKVDPQYNQCTDLTALLKAIVHGYLLRNLGARLPVSQYSVHETSTEAQDSSNCYISASFRK